MLTSNTLAVPLQQLHDALDDFRNTATIDTIKSLLARWVSILDTEPLHGFIDATAPEQEFLPWWTEMNGGHIASSGSRSIVWPPGVEERVGLQIGLCRAMATDQMSPFQTAHRYFNAGTKYHRDMLTKMANELLAPLLRDLGRLGEQRPVPTAIADLMRHRPRSSDSHLDGLLDEACRAFRDPAPQSHRRALETLWDAWERAKTLDGDKKTSAAAMLTRAAAGNEPFRLAIDAEAKALTAIGNDFHIRHHETSRNPLVDDAHVDYLVHRMLAMLALVLR